MFKMKCFLFVIFEWLLHKLAQSKACRVSHEYLSCCSTDSDGNAQHAQNQCKYSNTLFPKTDASNFNCGISFKCRIMFEKEFLKRFRKC